MTGGYNYVTHKALQLSQVQLVGVRFLQLGYGIDKRGINVCFVSYSRLALGGDYLSLISVHK